jgi:nitrite reductase (cytochrome c-552)
VWLLAVLFAIATLAVLMLMGNVSKRKAEATQVVFQIAKLDETIDDPAVWGQNYPRQYDAYKRTVDTQRTRFGGSEAFEKLDSDPNLRTMFNGYAFAIDYREERGHAYMLQDQRETERVTMKPQPGACLHCHASMVTVYRDAGLKANAPGDLKMSVTSKEGMAQLLKGWEVLNPQPYLEVTKLAKHPVACIDCHDPASMQLRVTRPGFMYGIRELAKSNDDLPHLPSIRRWRDSGRLRDYDPNIDASRQEMRSMVCAQCHVEYYFKGEQKTLTYPWHKGLRVQDIERYYDEVGFKDWTHADSGAPVLKAQHPEFEMWSQGVHARSGVACADCHMPYKREGAIKISDHQVRSPMLNISRACQTCHHYDETEIASRVELIQTRTKGMLENAEVAVVDLINAIKDAKAAGATDDQLKGPRDLQRKAQWRCDFVNAENSMGFHAPQESARILGESIDYARQGQIAVVKLGFPAPPSSTPAAPAKPKAATDGANKPAPAPATSVPAGH